MKKKNRKLSFLLIAFYIIVIVINPEIIKVKAEGSPPVLQSLGNEADFITGKSPVNVDPNITLSGEGTIDGAQVYIGDGFVKGEDSLQFIDQNNITGSYNSTTGVMTLSGIDSIANYQTALRSIKYSNSSATPNTTQRKVVYCIGGKVLYCPPTKHYYQYVEAQGITWTDAKTAAENSDYYGLKGYLVTITSQAENDFVQNKIAGNTWLGASDDDPDQLGHWTWRTGPEAGQCFWNRPIDVLPYSQSKRSNDGNFTYNGMYNNWHLDEPNNYENTNERYAHMYSDSGTWNDFRVDNGSISGYVIEYSEPDQNNPTLHLSAEVAVNIHTPIAPVLDNTSESLINSINEDDINSSGKLVSDLLSGKVTDINIDSSQIGIAVTSVDDSHGNWEYSTDGSQWWTMPRSEPTISENNALLIPATAKVRFSPATNFNGSVSIKYRAWDGTSGSSEGRCDVSSNGGNTAFSEAEGIATVTVNPVNDKPSIIKNTSSKMLSFDGANGHYMSVPDMHLNGSFTVEAWVKVDDFNNFSRIFDFGNGQANYNQELFFDSTSAKMCLETWCVDVDSPSRQGVYRIETSEDFPINTWMYVTAVYDNANKEGYIYWNGVLKASGHMEVPESDIQRNCNYFGKSNWSQDAYLKGSMYGMTVWNTNKSEDQIKSHMDNTPCGDEANLVAYYPLTEGSGSIVKDATSGKRDGTLNGVTWGDNSQFYYNVKGLVNSDIDINKVMLNDIDEQNEDMELTLSSAENGSITFTNTSEIEFASGENGGNSITVKGKKDALNAALTTLKYHPAVDYVGTDEISVILSDLGNTGLGGPLTDTKEINVNVLPSNSCDINSVITPLNANISGQNITASINTTSVSTNMNVDLTVSDKATWKLYSDELCTNEIANKSINLGPGTNKAYIKVTAQDGVSFKIYVLSITVNKEDTPNESIDKAKNSITEINILNNNVNLYNIIGGMAFPTSGAYGTTISWNSEPEGYVNTSTGAVTRPSYSEGDKNIKIIATISKAGGTSVTKEFIVTVKALSETQAEKEAEDRNAVTSDKSAVDVQYAAGDSINNVNNNITMTSSGANGSTITWISSDSTVVSNTGVVTRPSYMSGNKIVTFTATISKGNVTDTKIFMLTVKALPETQEEKDAEDKKSVTEDKSALDVQYAAGNNINNVNSNITMVSSGANGSTITWISSDPTVVSNTGIVTRPSYMSGNKIVTLTATISKGNITDTKIFILTVKALEKTVENLLSDASNLQIVYANKNNAYNVTNTIYLPNEGEKGSLITWNSNNPNVITNTGRVTRPEPDSQDAIVTLTAVLKDPITGTTVNKEFTLTVKKLTDEEAVNEAAKNLTVEQAIKFDSIVDTWESVTNKFILLTVGSYNSTITWTSSNPSIVNISSNSNITTGFVTRPDFEDENVILTATVTKGSSKFVKTFLIIVKQKNITKQQVNTRVSTDTNATIVNSGSINEATLNIQRTTLDGGKGIIDTLVIKNGAITSVTDNINPESQSSLRTVTINMPQPSDGTAMANSQAVEMAAMVVQDVSDRNANLEIKMDKVRISIDASVLKSISTSGTDLYFNVKPIYDSTERTELSRDVKTNDAIVPEGIPYMVETNYSGYNTQLVIPFTGITMPAVGRDAFLASLKVYVKHTDGTKEIKNGTIFYENGVPVGIEITVDRFSSFQIFTTATNKQSIPSTADAANTSKELQSITTLPKTGSVIDFDLLIFVGLIFIGMGLTFNVGWKLRKK